MKTYYIEIERQGWTLCIAKVEANTYEEAQLKALKARHAADDIYEISEEQALTELQNGEVDYIIDEDGCEVTLEDMEEEEDSKETGNYKLYMEDESGFENIYDCSNMTYDEVLEEALRIWDDGEGGYCKVSIHEVKDALEEISVDNQIWEAHH